MGILEVHAHGVQGDEVVGVGGDDSHLLPLLPPGRILKDFMTSGRTRENREGSTSLTSSTTTSLVVVTKVETRGAGRSLLGFPRGGRRGEGLLLLPQSRPLGRLGGFLLLPRATVGHEGPEGGREDPGLDGHIVAVLEGGPGGGRGGRGRRPPPPPPPRGRARTPYPWLWRRRRGEEGPELFLREHGGAVFLPEEFLQVPELLLLPRKRQKRSEEASPRTNSASLSSGRSPLSTRAFRTLRAEKESATEPHLPPQEPRTSSGITKGAAMVSGPGVVHLRPGEPLPVVEEGGSGKALLQPQRDAVDHVPHHGDEEEEQGRVARGEEEGAGEGRPAPAAKCFTGMPMILSVVSM